MWQLQQLAFGLSLSREGLEGGPERGRLKEEATGKEFQERLHRVQ